MAQHDPARPPASWSGSAGDRRRVLARAIVNNRHSDTTPVVVKVRAMMAPLVALVVVVEPSPMLDRSARHFTEHRRSSSTRIWVRSTREAAQRCVSAIGAEVLQKIKVRPTIRAKRNQLSVAVVERKISLA
jgi:hypothetical protein